MWQLWFHEGKEVPLRVGQETVKLISGSTGGDARRSIVVRQDSKSHDALKVLLLLFIDVHTRTRKQDMRTFISFMSAMPSIERYCRHVRLSLRYVTRNVKGCFTRQI